MFSRQFFTYPHLQTYAEEEEDREKGVGVDQQNELGPPPCHGALVLLGVYH